MLSYYDGNMALGKFLAQAQVLFKWHSSDQLPAHVCSMYACLGENRGRDESHLQALVQAKLASCTMNEIAGIMNR